MFVIDGEDVKAQPSTWDALGLPTAVRAHQVEDVSIPASQIVRPRGATAPPRIRGSSSASAERLALGGIDIAKRQTTRKKHVDVGLRVADYPTIQDYVGEVTNACRLFGFSVAQWTTPTTTPSGWRGEFARANFLHWAWQIKFEASQEHRQRRGQRCCTRAAAPATSATWRWSATFDAKAGVMGYNEVLRQFVGKAVLLLRQPDYWNQTYNRRAVENEVKKLDADDKRKPPRSSWPRLRRSPRRPRRSRRSRHRGLLVVDRAIERCRSTRAA